MNNFFLNQDPLLNQQTYDNPTPIMFQQIPNAKDCIGELDRTLKGLSPAVLAKLSENTMFNRLNSSFQAIVQQELLSLVRNKLNLNSDVVNNVNEQLRIIDEIKKNVELFSLDI